MEVLLSIVAALTALKYSFKFFFNNTDELLDCIKFWFTPDIISIFRNEYERDWWSELKLFIWSLTGVLVGYATYQFLAPV